MRHPAGGHPARTRPDGTTAGGSVPTGTVADAVAAATQRLTRPGIVILTGPPGSGRSTLLRRVAAATTGPVHTGGGLAALGHVPAFPLSHALRVRLPGHDTALLAEAVRSRVRHGLLVLDDLQWADPATVAALPAIARHCRVVVALRTPHQLPDTALDPLRGDTGLWLTVPAPDPDTLADLIRRAAPTLDPATVAAVARHAGGNPLAATALARHAARTGTPPTVGGTPGGAELDQVGYAVAAALATLTRPARTALAALGLLGHGAPASLLGDGVTELTAADLVHTGDDGLVTPTSPYQAAVAAGLLDDPARRALHRRLADLVTDPLAAARHLAAAGDTTAAYQRAVTAADTAATGGARAELLLFASAQPDATEPVRLAAARAALTAGRPRRAADLLTGTALPTPDTAVLRAEALLQAGDPTAARTAAAPVPDDTPPPVVAARDRVLLLADLATDPTSAAVRATTIARRHGPEPAHLGLRAALAATAAAGRRPGWEYALAGTAAAAGAAGDLLTARWTAWHLVQTLAGDGRLTEAAQAAVAAATACAADLAYSWQVRFTAARLWCLALRGDPTGPATAGTGAQTADQSDPLPAAGDALLRAAADLTDRTLPAAAHDYAVAAAGLLEADSGLLAPARARLTGGPGTPNTATAVLDWVAREAAWLDGQPDQATAGAPHVPVPPLVDGLRRITAHWAAHDGADPATPPAATPVTLPAPAAATVTAWTAGDPRQFAHAADTWRDVAVREQVRCLLAHGLHEPDPARAVPALLAAESLAEHAGLVVLLGRVRRALRRHAVRRDERGPRSGDLLTVRERDVLRLVARGEPTRRIANQLGISTETVETHVRAGMRKLGARTRTEAAALAMEPDHR
ncbi:LuxR C-terminal-related transcriptional regulator [Solwaraspora sp. WMMD792]|uniref:helix-turn-helix transcriptional regulator n=1 Tax=Solwaraspora sp. WMMD792 TaxID=3016099 RepID=UPI002417FF0C|nr:LuxR C-terminal-related transcriptional regulator [Solwaraspora sp. WMMD792]MDG4770988.1 LuxR C-terminal-related transcriptional regulator [Solwaraspora sp. WMMD792]